VSNFRRGVIHGIVVSAVALGAFALLSMLDDARWRSLLWLVVTVIAWGVSARLYREKVGPLLLTRPYPFLVAAGIPWGACMFFLMWPALHLSWQHPAEASMMFAACMFFGAVGVFILMSAGALLFGGMWHFLLASD
jgi:hypothetical protein